MVSVASAYVLPRASSNNTFNETYCLINQENASKKRK